MNIGIDFGTTKSVVAAYIGGVPTILPDEEGRRYMPSVVAVPPDQSLRIGWEATNLPPFERWSSKFFTINSIKRSLGHQGETNWGALRAYPQEIAALILRRLKLQAETQLGAEVTGAVLATPAYFNINERWALCEAAEAAGLRVLRTIHEPTAAALAYGLQHKQDHRVAIFDFGGGTFDISILEIGAGVYEVKATKGDTRLGGVDLTQALLNYACDDFKKREGVDLAEHPEAMSRLTEAIEQVKCDLSFQADVSIKLPYLVTDPYPKHMDFTISRARFEELTSSIRDRVKRCCEDVLRDASLSPDKIDTVVLVGTATRTPSIIDVARAVFRQEPLRSLDPAETVALGAAIEVETLVGELKDTLLLDVTPLSLGIATQGGIMSPLIARNTTIPTKKSEIFSTTEDNQAEVTIRVFQGENKMVNDNVLVGNITLTGLAPAPRGVAQLEVTLDIDARGILLVKANDLGTNSQVEAIFDRPDCCLNVAQRKVLARKVDAELNRVQRKINTQRDLHRQEQVRAQAKSFGQSIAMLCEKTNQHLTAPTVKLLREGEHLIQDYLDRSVAADDIAALVLRIKPLRDQAAIEWCLGTLDRIWFSEAFSRWVECLSRPADTAQLADALHTLLSACSAEIEAAKYAFIYAIGTADAHIPQQLLLDTVATSRSRRLCLELIASCFVFADIDVPNWALTEPQQDKILQAILWTLAGHARQLNKRVSVWDHLSSLSDEKEILKLLQILFRTPSMETTWALIGIVGRFSGEVRKTALDALNTRQDNIRQSLLQALQNPELRTHQLGALLAARHVELRDYQDHAIQLWNAKMADDVKLMLVEAITGASSVVQIMTLLNDPAPAVREIIWSHLLLLERKMDKPSLRFYRIAKKVIRQKRTANYFERRFLKKLAVMQPAWRHLASQLLEGKSEKHEL